MSSSIVKCLSRSLLKVASTHSSYPRTAQLSSSSSAVTPDNCGTKQPTKKKSATKTKTPKGKFDDNYDDAPKSYSEQEPLKKHVNNVNPATGEQGGPAGPEPTRYGDWERKGRVTDF